MKRQQRMRALWIVLMGMIVLSGVAIPLWVSADSGDVSLTATLYADVVRFEAESVTSLRVTVYDLSENELWSSAQVMGDFVDWDRTNAYGERLANGYYLYLAQGWDTSDQLILNRTGKVVLLPGNRVELKTAPSSGPGGIISSEVRDPINSTMAWAINDSITSTESAGVSNFLQVIAGSGGDRAGFQMYGYNAANSGDFATFTMRTDKPDAVFSVYDNSAAMWHPAFNFNYLQNEFDFKDNDVVNVGQLGVGTASPSTTLDVSGTGRFTGALTVGAYTLPTADGSNGQVLATNGSGAVSWQTVSGGGSGYWTAAGNDIANTNTGTITLKVNEHLFLHDTGNQSVFLGEFAGSAIVAGEENHNTAVGYEALRLTTTGCDNTAVGKDALMNNTEGDRNTAVGEEALDQNTTGSCNTAIGAHAMIENLTGIRNTAVGENALDSMTVGQDNIAVGQGAGNLLTSGSRNIYIGHDGLASEFGTIRIGNSTDHDEAYLAGVRGVAVTGGEYVVVDANGQLGSTAAAGGSGYWSASGDDISNSNSGNVGVGTSSPEVLLHVDGRGAFGDSVTAGAATRALNLVSTDAVLRVFRKHDTDDPAVELLAADADGSNLDHWDMFVEHEADYLGIRERMTNGLIVGVGTHLVVEAGGNVGVGTTDPDRLLDVSGTGRFTGALTLGSYTLPTADGTNGQVLSTNGSGTVSWQTIAGGSSQWTTSGDDIYSSNSGNVGIGDTTPSQKLEVDGSIAMSGYLYQGTDLLLHNSGSVFNVFLGNSAGNGSVTGDWNTSVGAIALSYLTSGERNTAMGSGALAQTETGDGNTAIGDNALAANVAGAYNTAVGSGALANFSGTEHNNTAIGASALLSLGSGSGNIALGQSAGSANTGGADNIYIGNVGAVETATIRIGGPAQTSAYMAGIYGGTVSGGTAVYIGSDGRLGTLTSSARFKTGIADLGPTSDVLYDLRPVTFAYKPEIDPLGITQYGLIAEEVAEVAPDLVIYDDAGDPYTVRYEQLVPMLLNELQEQDTEIAQLRAELEELKEVVARLIE